MIKKLIVSVLVILCIVSISSFNDTVHATELDTSKYEILNPTKSLFSITDKVYLINGKAPTGTEVTIDVYGTTDLTKKSFNLDCLPSKDDYIETSSETVISGNMGFFQKQLDLVMGINKVVVSFNVDEILPMEYIIFVYDKSVTESKIIKAKDIRFSSLTPISK